ncbi:MAG: ATP-dependent DNA helicase [Oscillospiraceae bacterium]|nr:ATP-dependent DNA helicase [Oscillospiraceae bacterium]
MFTEDNRKNAHNMIDWVFMKLFPARGMTERPEQVQLSHQMLDTMLDDRIALCDAGTGIGKTYAYLVAGMALILFRAAMGLAFRPIVISTSSIALQRAITEEYIPLLSVVLMEGMWITAPIQAVIRKGKSHYVCDMRLEIHLRRINLQKKNSEAAAALLSLQSHLDMDEAAHLSRYDQERVCVPTVCSCGKDDCRYRRFLKDCFEKQYQFQICNHNLLLANAIHRSQDRRPILLEHTALVVDEAHKLPEAARQMFGMTLCAGDIQAMVRDLRSEQYLLAAENLAECSGPIRRKLSEPWDAERPLEVFLRLLIPPNRSLRMIQSQLKTLLTLPSQSRLESLVTAVSLFCDGNPDMVFYTMADECGCTTLCATVSNLTAQLRSVLWEQPGGMVLTSGTIAVGRNFQRYKAEVGLSADNRVDESVSLSPFDYRRNCLLYFSLHPPKHKKRNYYDRLTDEIAALIEAAYGHTLVLFTSYAAMSAVKERLAEQDLSWPMFTMGRNAVHTTEQFKSRPGSILLATGAAWEGFDFPGDGVSLLIIPRLPFPHPDVMKEKERKGYSTLRTFIRAVVIPEMQIKLKQGFGRAIRMETDTCVIAILDERAGPGCRYFPDVKAALPDMQITTSINEIEQFIRSVKPDDYFREILP